MGGVDARGHVSPMSGPTHTRHKRMARATQRGTRENSILSIVRYSSARRENGPGWRGRHSGELHARARRLGGVRPDGEGVLVWERVPPLRPPPAPAGPSGGGLTRRKAARG